MSMVKINCIPEYLHSMYISCIISIDKIMLENEQKLLKKSAKLYFYSSSQLESIGIILGSIVIQFGSIVIILGSIVIILGSIVIILGSMVII